MQAAMRTLPHRCSATSLIVAGALCASAAVARAQTNTGPNQIDQPEVVNLTIRGVKKVSEHDLARSISTQASSCKSLLVRLFCMASQSSLWWNHHYFDALEYQRDVLRIKV